MNNFDGVGILQHNNTELRFSAILVADIHSPIWRTDAARNLDNASIVRRGRIT